MPERPVSIYTVRLEHGRRRPHSDLTIPEDGPVTPAYLQHPVETSYVQVAVPTHDEHGKPRPDMEMDNEARNVAVWMHHDRPGVPTDMVTKADIIRLEASAGTQMVRPSQFWDHVRHFDWSGDLRKVDKLADSIREHGYRPDWGGKDRHITVTLDPEPAISNGHRRLKAMEQIGYDEPVPMVIQGALNEPGSREELVRHAEGRQPLYQPADGSGSPACAFHALDDQSWQQRMHQFGRQVKLIGPDEPAPDEPALRRVGEGACGRCAHQQHELRRYAPKPEQFEQNRNWPGSAFHAEPDRWGDRRTTAPFAPLRQSLNAHQTGRESDWREGNELAASSPEDIERFNADKWAPNIRDHGPYRLVHPNPTYGSGNITAHVQDAHGWKGVGYLSYTRRHDHPDKPTEIHKVHVHPDHQNQGLASAMLALGRESHPEMQHSRALTDDGRAWAEKIGALDEQPLLHRGVMLSTSVSDLVKAHEHGGMDAVHRHLHDLAMTHQQEINRVRKTDPGVGTHWTTDLPIANKFAQGWRFNGDYDTAPHTRSSYNNDIDIPVRFSARIAPEHHITDPDELRHHMVEGHGWEQDSIPTALGRPLPPRENETLVRKGAPVDIEHVHASLPTHPDWIHHLREAHDNWEHEDWGDKEHSWQRIGGGIRATASLYSGDHVFRHHSPHGDRAFQNIHILEAWDPEHADTEWATAHPHDRTPYEGSFLDPGHRPAGSISWDQATGEIKGIHSVERRQGLATEMLRRAREIAAIQPGISSPVHSDFRSESGDAWAKSTGDEIPPRKASRSLDELARDGYCTDEWGRWQQGDCYTYAHALKRMAPHLSFGALGDGVHLFVHDGEHAYDSAGKHPMPYHGINGTMPDLETDDRTGDWYDQPDEGEIPAAQAHARRNGILEGRYGPRTTKQASLDVRDYEGETGNRDHITRTERGMLPIGAVRHMRGVRGEIPGEHRNRKGEDWEAFKADIAANGIKSPIFITVDHGEEPKLSEGSHRRDAAVELGHAEIPAEIRYYGHAEQQGTVEERAMRHEAVRQGDRSVCPCGIPAEYDQIDGWQHADGSISHEDGESVSDKMRRVARFTPHLRVFAPTCGLDHVLFDENGRLYPQVRADLLRKFNLFCLAHCYREWSKWAKINFCGSEASEWTSSTLEGNGDFDILVGVEYHEFRKANPAYLRMSNVAISQMLTQQMHAMLNDPDYHPPMSVTP